MTSTVQSPQPGRQAGEHHQVTRAVSGIIAVVVGLTFLFGFGNVLTLALRLGVPVWVAPLVAPAVDLSVCGLLLAVRHLALNGASREDLRPARYLLIFASLVTLALNIADPLLAAEYGKAAFDAVGPMLLIGWAEVGPGLLRALSSIGSDVATLTIEDSHPDLNAEEHDEPTLSSAQRESNPDAELDLLERARQEDARHWREHRRPISADSLRKILGIGSARSRELVATIRTELQQLGEAA